jgi:AcrR family transcriptional regulator
LYPAVYERGRDVRGARGVRRARTDPGHRLRAVFATGRAWRGGRRGDHTRGVAKATLYAHFPSKDDLLLAFLERREQRWTLGFIAAETRRRGATAEEQLLAVFDALDEWFRRDDFEGCSFIKLLLELGPEHPAGDASVHHLRRIRWFVQSLAEEAGLRESEEFAWSCHLLMQGAIVAAAAGDIDSAQRAKTMAGELIDRFRLQVH